MEQPDQPADENVILQGQLSQELGITRILQLVSEHRDVQHGVLKVKTSAITGFIAINNGCEISGALTQPFESAGALALQELFILDEGDYVYRRLPQPPDNLDQSLHLSIDKLFSQMNKVLVEAAIKQGRTPALAWMVDTAFSPNEIWTTQQLRKMATLTLPVPSLPNAAPEPSPEPAKPKVSWAPVALSLVAAGALVILATQIFSAVGTKSHLQAGIKALSQGMTDQAAREFSLALESDPRLDTAYLYRAIAYSRQGNSDKAIADYTTLLQKDSGNTQALLGRACQYLKTKDFDKAKADCDEALKADENCDDAYRIRAIAQARLGNYDPAVADCRFYLKRVGDKGNRSQRADIYAVLAMARLKDDQFGAAIDDYSTAISLDSKSSSLYSGRASAFKTAGDWKNAIADCDKAIKLGGGWDVYQLRASAEQAAGNAQKAVLDLSEALKQAPGNLQLYKERAEAESLTGKYQEAGQDYHYLLQHSPGDREIMAKYSFVRSKLSGSGQRWLDDFNEAPQAAVAMAKYKGDSQTLTKTGYELLRRGQNAEAMLALTAALQGNPDNHQARLYLAHAMVLSGNFKAAADQFAIMAKLGALTLADKISYAHSLEMSGQPKLATTLYEQCLAADGTNKEVRMSLIDLYSRSGALEKGERAAADGVARSTAEADRRIFEQKTQELKEPKTDSKNVDNQT